MNNNASSPTPGPSPATPGTSATEQVPPVALPMTGRSLVALSLLVGAVAFLFYNVPVFFPEMIHVGGLLQITAILCIDTAAIILAVIAAALFLVGSLRWGFVDEWRPMILSLKETTERNEEQLKLMAGRILISETAKRITYRDRDRQALREAIQEDLNKGDFDAAMVLVSEMSKAYGYTNEAEQYREQIENLRHASINDRVKEALVGFEDLLKKTEWDKATAEAAKIQRLFPDAPQVRDLPKQVSEAWQARKHELERKLLQSASHDDVESSMETLRELDRYLKPEEAAPFLEVARGVIGKKRQNLGVQFKLAIQDKEWTQSVAVGEQIIRE